MKRPVLIVDDDSDSRETMCLRLSHAGFSTVAAGNGEEAIATYDALRPQIVILDASMPGISGFDVCRYIKEQSAIPPAKIILVSGAIGTGQKYVERCLRACDGDRLITKPYDGGHLVNTVQEIEKTLEAVSKSFRA